MNEYTVFLVRLQDCSLGQKLLQDGIKLFVG